MFSMQAYNERCGRFGKWFVGCWLLLVVILSRLMLRCGGWRVVAKGELVAMECGSGGCNVEVLNSSSS